MNTICGWPDCPPSLAATEQVGQTQVMLCAHYVIRNLSRQIGDIYSFLNEEKKKLISYEINYFENQNIYELIVNVKLFQ